MKNMTELAKGFIGVSAIALTGLFAGRSLDSDIYPDTLVVDVRSPSEFENGHFPNALNIPLDSIRSRLTEFEGPDRAIIVYCQSGARSGTALQILKNEGFRNVENGGGLSQMRRRQPPKP